MGQGTDCRRGATDGRRVYDCGYPAHYLSWGGGIWRVESSPGLCCFKLCKCFLSVRTVLGNVLGCEGKRSVELWGEE